METIYQINEFANKCGYFYDAETDNFTCNNGYNCRHPQQEETDTNDETGENVGRCHAWSCPLGYEADEEDFRNPDIDNNGWSEWEEGNFIIVDETEGDTLNE